MTGMLPDKPPYPCQCAIWNGLMWTVCDEQCEWPSCNELKKEIDSSQEYDGEDF